MQLRYKFLLLICEELASDTIYQTQNTNFLKNFNWLLEKYFLEILRDQKVLEKIFEYYKTTINSKYWQKNIGAVHGFVKFCEVGN